MEKSRTDFRELSRARYEFLAGLDMAKVITERYGYSKTPKQKNVFQSEPGKNPTHKIHLSRKNGVSLYNDFRGTGSGDKHGGTLTHFLRDYANLTPAEIRQLAKDYGFQTGIVKSFSPPKKIITQPEETSQADFDRWEAAVQEQLQPKGDTYLTRRSIPKEVSVSIEGFTTTPTEAQFPLKRFDAQGRLRTTNVLKYYFRKNSTRGKLFMKQEGTGSRGLSLLTPKDVVTNRILVFESPVDALSYRALALQHPTLAQREASTLYLSTCGAISTSQKTDLKRLFEKKQGAELIFALDNDDAGKKMTAELAKIAQELGRSYTTFAPKGKDWNDDLVAGSALSVEVPAPEVVPEKPAPQEQAAVPAPKPVAVAATPIHEGYKETADWPAQAPSKASGRNATLFTQAASSRPTPLPKEEPQVAPSIRQEDRLQEEWRSLRELGKTHPLLYSPPSWSKTVEASLSDWTPNATARIARLEKGKSRILEQAFHLPFSSLQDLNLEVYGSESVVAFPLFHFPEGEPVLSSTIDYRLQEDGSVQERFLAQPGDGSKGFAYFGNRAATRVVLCESPIDALCYRALALKSPELAGKEPNTLYLASCGPISRWQTADLKRILASGEERKEVLLLTNPSENGKKVAAASHRLLREAGLSYHILSPEKADWQQELQAGMPIANERLEKSTDREKKALEEIDRGNIKQSLEKGTLDPNMKVSEAAAADFLKGAGRNLGKEKPKYGTLLLWAAVLGRPEAVTYLIMYGADVLRKDNRDRTALHLRALASKCSTSNLLDAAAVATFRGAQVWTKLRRQQDPITKSLLEAGVPANQQDDQGNTALHYVGEAGNNPLVLQHLEGGASPSLRNHAGITARQAAQEAGHLSTALIIRGYAKSAQKAFQDALKKENLSKGNTQLQQHPWLGGAVDLLTAGGKTLLHRVAAQGQDTLLDACLRQRASIHALDELGRTPFLAAAAAGQLTALKALQQAGAAWNVLDQAGNTAFHLLAEGGHAPIIDALVQELGATVSEECNQAGLTALQVAAAQGHTEACLALVANGSNPRAIGAQGNAAELAEAKGHPKTAKALFALGVADPNKTLENIQQAARTELPLGGWEKALWKGVQENDSGLVKQAMAHGASPNQANNEGYLPHHIAAKQGNESLCLSLLAAGADKTALSPEGKGWAGHLEEACPKPKVQLKLSQGRSKSQAKTRSEQKGIEI